MKHPNDLVITGTGVVTAQAVGLAAHWQLISEGRHKSSPSDYSLRQFKAAEHISDRRMLKGISVADAIGLAAIVNLCSDGALESDTYAPERVGLYVGAPPASLSSHEPYLEAMAATRGSDGRLCATDFGKACQRSRPMTLLVGLLNNVLCYGAMLLNARGPNSNYTSVALAAHHSVINAAKRVRRGALDRAVAGGFTARFEPADRAILASHGLLRRQECETVLASPNDAEVSCGGILADGAAFLAIERRREAQHRGAQTSLRYCSGAVTADALGPLLIDPEGRGLERAIREALDAAAIPSTAIGLVLANISETQAGLDQMEWQVLQRLFGEDPAAAPAIAVTTPMFGNLLEAGGILEVGLVPGLYDAGEVPTSLRPKRVDTQHMIHQDRPYALVLRTSPWGEYSSLIVKWENT